MRTILFSLALASAASVVASRAAAESQDVPQPDATASAAQPAAGEPGSAAQPAAGEPGSAAQPAAGEPGPAAQPAARAPDAMPETQQLHSSLRYAASPPEQPASTGAVRGASGNSGAVEPPPDAAGGTDWTFVGGLASWAAGMGFVVAFNYAFFRLNDVVMSDSMKAFRQGVPSGESSCDRARAGTAVSAPDAPSPGEIADLCDEADSMEALRNAALPIGLALGILGVVLIGTSDTVNGPPDKVHEARRWRVNGGVGPSGGSASLQISF